MAEAQAILAWRENGVIRVRSEPLRLMWTLVDLAAADGQSLLAAFACRVRPLDTPTERRMLEEVFLSAAPTLTADMAQQHFLPGLQRAAGEKTRSQPTETWLAAHDELESLLRETVQRIAFTCGLEILPPFELHLQSPSLDRRQREDEQRRLAEQRLQQRGEHVRRTLELLRQFENPAAALPQLSPADQADAARALLAAESATQTPELMVVSGNSLLQIRGDQTASWQLPGTAGPLRCVQPAGSNHLLIGARGGVWLIDRRSPGTPQLFALATDSRHGFNSAVLHRDQLWAAHSELGIVRWQPEPGAIARQIWPVGARHLRQAGEQLVFSSGSTLHRLALDGQISTADSADAPIVEVLDDPGGWLVVRADGRVRRLDRQSLHPCQERHFGHCIVTAAALPWPGGIRLLLVDDHGTVTCAAMEDEVVLRYGQASRFGVRRLAGAAGRVAAVSADRCRLICWNGWDCERIDAEIHIPAVSGHRIADITFMV